MSNANYTSALSSFATNAYYAAADLGAMNAVGDAGSFGAFVTFSISSAMQLPGGVPTPATQFLWGNSLDASFLGWAFELITVGGELVLQAKVGNAAAFVVAQEPITGPAVAATGQLPGAGAFERIIQASLWCDDTNLILAVNGTICAFTAFDAATYAPSSLVATLGAGGALIAANPASACEIIAAGYTNFPGLNVAGNVGAFIGGAFSNARETGNDAFISSPAGIDWTHRYAARTLGQGAVGTLNKNAVGSTVVYPTATGPLVDQGNSGRANQLLPPNVPVNLVRAGNSDTLPKITQRKNVDWAAFGTFFYTP